MYNHRNYFIAIYLHANATSTENAKNTIAVFIASSQENNLCNCLVQIPSFFLYVLSTGTFDTGHFIGKKALLGNYSTLTIVYERTRREISSIRDTHVKSCFKIESGGSWHWKSLSISCSFPSSFNTHSSTKIIAYWSVWFIWTTGGNQTGGDKKLKLFKKKTRIYRLRNSVYNLMPLET